ncbi:hypothetical protein F4821DRAFT_245667 [Hypoxylon rubiginosum]|uniref:Uncharacterized protein n=1 Tax=Hypoxylon rubiginosum TaxID=110542 RepID=A0ACC0CR84_9PEZI|nr:hypothetical protein F4821DRAFT_245667 [Hypoxylon rubiginosum]
MQVLPFVQVRDLPSSASFYSAITQPLKLRYISANSSSIVFGDTTYSASPDPVFEVRKASAGHRLTPSRLVLSAHSPSVVTAFRAAALRADPDVLISRDGESRVVIADVDGNKIEVACSSRSGYPASYGGSTAVPSDAGDALVTRDSYHAVRRSHTTSAIETPPRETPRGFGTPGAGMGMGAVLGAAAVGVAVGGALTYTMMRNDRQRAPRQEYDTPRSSFYRRASAPDSQPNLRPRVETIYDPDEYATVSPRKYPPISYGSRYSQIEGPDRSTRALEDVDDRASRRSGHSKSRRSSDAGGSTRRPLMIADVEYRSNASSKHGTAPKLLLDHEYRSQAGSKYTTTPSRHHAAEDDHHRHRHSSRSRVSSRDRTPRPVEEATYVSARSKRSASTVRPVEKQQHHSSSSRHHGHGHGRSRASSYASARDRDYDGKSRDSWENWESGDDVESLAPSDSISCAGGGRSEHHASRRSRQNPLPSGPGSFVGRYRKVVTEFDEKHRPLYGSEHY